MIEDFKKARAAGVPIINIHSIDPVATMNSIQMSISGAIDSPGESEYRNSIVPIVQWDIISGWRSRNSAGKDAIEYAQKLESLDLDMTINPTKSLELSLLLPENTIFFFINPRFYMDRPDFIQAISNVREEFKSEGKILVFIGSHFSMPPELQHDVLTLDEPLPDDKQLRSILEELVETNEIKFPKEQRASTIDALRGLGAFTAEQALAMNLSSNDVDLNGVWERKRQMISETPGLKVYKDEMKFDSIGGCDQVKKFLTGIINGKEAPNVIVFIDEGEKMFAGSSGNFGDSSGVSQDYLGTMLSYMEDNECDGTIFVGPPGAAKSAIAKAMGNEAKIPTIVLDLGGMKGSLVGQSEARLRTALKVITAVGSGRAYFVMTCNKITSLPPELKRRFTSGTFFFDLPTTEERKLIWDIYIKKYGLKDIVNFDEEGWTGAEIRNCCRMAYRQNISLKEAAEFIVPVAKAAKEQILALRTQASGAFLSANHKGVYTYDSIENNKEVKKRKLNL